MESRTVAISELTTLTNHQKLKGNRLHILSRSEGGNTSCILNQYPTMCLPVKLHNTSFFSNKYFVASSEGKHMIGEWPPTVYLV